MTCYCESYYRFTCYECRQAIEDIEAKDKLKLLLKSYENKVIQAMPNEPKAFSSESSFHNMNPMEMAHMQSEMLCVKCKELNGGCICD